MSRLFYLRPQVLRSNHRINVLYPAALMQKYAVAPKFISFQQEPDYKIPMKPDEKTYAFQWPASFSFYLGFKYQKLVHASPGNICMRGAASLVDTNQHKEFENVMFYQRPLIRAGSTHNHGAAYYCFSSFEGDAKDYSAHMAHSTFQFPTMIWKHSK